MAKKQELQPMSVVKSIENLNNYHMDVVALRMTIHMYNNMLGSITDIDLLKNAIKIISKQCDKLEQYSNN
jgi:hypothetical protein